jgi:hypothetical protein
MKKYKVLIAEHNYGSIIIRAKNEEEAQKKAVEKIWNMDSLELSKNVWEETKVDALDVILEK